mgnify:CR=1 FL=1
MANLFLDRVKSTSRNLFETEQYYDICTFIYNLKHWLESPLICYCLSVNCDNTGGGIYIRGSNEDSSQSPYSMIMDTLKMDSANVARKLITGDYKMRSVSSGKSEVWKIFGIVVDTENSTVLDFVACKQCHHVLAYHGRQTGTSTLKKHKCKVPVSQTLLSSVAKTLQPKPGIAKASKDTITKACVNFVCQDLRPFDTVSGDGFINLVQEVSHSTISFEVEVPVILNKNHYPISACHLLM